MFEYGITHLSMLFLFVYLFGYLYGIVALTIFVYVFSYVISIFGYEMASGRDLSFFYDDDKSIHN